MNLFRLLTPVSYWLLIVMWSYILYFYIRRITSSKVESKFFATLMIILSIDAFRTLFESIYFGAWYTSLVGFIPMSIHDFLVQPAYVFIPKFINVVAAALVLVILVQRWIPHEEEERLKQIQHTDALEREIAERRCAEKELIKARDLAETAERLKSQFLANMSHEIRTPMNAVIGMTDLLADTELNREQRYYADTVRKSADSLLAIINDILDFSKIEAGKLEMANEPFDLSECVEDAVEILAPRAEEKRIDLASYFGQNLPQGVMGDCGRLRQVLINLISNAVKFTEEGSVLVRVTRSEEKREDGRETIQIEIQDTGIGIREEDRRRLFQPFTQIDETTTRKYGGTGLGLAICRRLVDLMGGTIKMESEVGSGTTVRLNIPFETTTEIAASESRISSAETLRGTRALVVDDNDLNRHILSTYLLRWEFAVEAATNGEQALRMLKNAAEEQQPFAVAILDYQMPRMDGEQLAIKIKSDATIQSTKLILLSSVSHHASEARLHEAGFERQLIKPIKRSALFDSLLEVLGESLPAEPKPSMRKARDLHALSASERSRICMLVVEDVAANRELARRLLEKAGFRCDTAPDGKQALRAFEKGSYSMILMDCQMPEMDGYEATREIRKREKPGEHIPILAITAEVMEEDRKRCLESGMDGYILKPISKVSFFQTIYEHLPAAKAEPSDKIELPPGESAGKIEAEERAGEKVPVDLNALQQSLGDMDLVRDLIGAFLEENEDRIIQLKNALADRDDTSVYRLAHAIKGACLNFKAGRLVSLALDLELRGKQHDLEGADPIYEALVDEFKRVQDYLKTI